MFDGVRGPEAPTVVRAENTITTDTYGGGTSSRLAVFVTDTNSCWLPLVHSLKTAGIPITVTRDLKEALAHKCVLVYPRLSWNALGNTGVRSITSLPMRGGTLIACGLDGKGITNVFGCSGTTNSYFRTRLEFSKGVCESCGFLDQREQELSFGLTDSTAMLATNSYLDPREAPLARYADQSAAIVQRTYAAKQGYGRAIALGVDLGYLAMRAYGGRVDNVARSYVNEFEPGLDLFLRMVKKIYREAVPEAVTLSTVPSGKDLAVVITHDVDFTKSVVNALEYAKYEKSVGITSTYFIQTKYMKDWNDNLFFNDTGIASLHALKEMGMDLGSHSVSHSRIFSKFPLGTGDEQYPAYTPIVQSATETFNGSILGELRTSKYLLEHLVGGPVRSFRPGHLQYPFALPEALEATGFQYSSTVTANAALTHLPFRLSYTRGKNDEVNVFEFPITIEDEAPPSMLDRLPEALTLADKLKKYGGTFVILIHPNVTGEKLKFEQGFVDSVKPYSWFGSMSELGDWWSARDQVSVDVDQATKSITLRTAIPVKGLAIELPPEWKISAAGTSQVDNRLVISQLDSSMVLKAE